MPIHVVAFCISLCVLFPVSKIAWNSQQGSKKWARITAFGIVMIHFTAFTGAFFFELGQDPFEPRFDVSHVYLATAAVATILSYILGGSTLLVQSLVIKQRHNEGATIQAPPPPPPEFGNIQ